MEHGFSTKLSLCAILVMDPFYGSVNKTPFNTIQIQKPSDRKTFWKASLFSRIAFTSLHYHQWWDARWDDTWRLAWKSSTREIHLSIYRVDYNFQRNAYRSKFKKKDSESSAAIYVGSYKISYFEMIYFVVIKGSCEYFAFPKILVKPIERMFIKSINYPVLLV